MTYLPRYQPRSQEPIRIPARGYRTNWPLLGFLLVSIGVWWIVAYLKWGG